MDVSEPEVHLGASAAPDPPKWLQAVLSQQNKQLQHAISPLLYIYILYILYILYAANYTSFYFAYYFPEKMHGVFLDYLDVFFI